MNSYIYTGKLHIEGREIPAMWTARFDKIWVGDMEFNGYRDFIKYVQVQLLYNRAL